MKKRILVIILAIICILFTGCEKSWKSKIELTNLKIEDDYITGKIKNKTDKFYEVSMYYIVKNGDFTDNGHCSIKIKPNAIDNIKCLEMNYDSSYSVKVKDVILSELTIPKLDNNNLNEESLEYYYYKIYDSHTLHMTSLVYDIEEKNYPYINKITYNDTENTIDIFYKYSFNGSSVVVLDKYDAESQKNKSFTVRVIDPTDDNLSKIRARLSGMVIVDDSTANSITVNQALSRTDIESGKCFVVGKWCVTAINNDEYTTFYMEKK